MATLDGSGTPVTLPAGVVLRAPGLRGTAEVRPRLMGGRAGEPPRATGAFEEALSRAGMVQSVAVEIQAQEVRVTGGTDVRAVDGSGALALEVPDLGPRRGQVLLAADEQGVLSWHYPESSAAPADGASRGSGSLRFVVPRQVATAAPAGGAERVPQDRSLVTMVGRKVLSVLVYPILDPLIGKGALFLAERWERQHRPHQARAFGLDVYRQPEPRLLDGAAWERLSEGRALLFLHGTFGTSHGAFGGVDAETMRALGAAYGERLLGFDHPSLSVDPSANARAFAERIPQGLSLDVDVLCHSRGGLVARAMAGEMGATVPGLSMRRIVFVGTPNLGTPLADPKHMGAFVDRITALLNLIPPGPWTTVVDLLESVLEVVKILGQGALGGLPGLASMDPKGDFVRRLNQPGGAGPAHYAINADFEPTGSLASVWRGADLVLDKVFADQLNDGVVPSKGVWTAGGDTGFPVQTDRRLDLGSGHGVWHCSYFSQPLVNQALLGWLTG